MPRYGLALLARASGCGCDGARSAFGICAPGRELIERKPYASLWGCRARAPATGLYFTYIAHHTFRIHYSGCLRFMHFNFSSTTRRRLSEQIICAIQNAL
jgi:hypothetical protein